MALSKSEGAGSVRAVVRLPGAHLYIQVLGNLRTPRLAWSRHHLVRSDRLSDIPSMFSKSYKEFVPLPLPDHVARPTEESAKLAKSFLADMRKRHTVRDFSAEPIP